MASSRKARPRSDLPIPEATESGLAALPVKLRQLGGLCQQESGHSQRLPWPNRGQYIIQASFLVRKYLYIQYDTLIAVVGQPIPLVLLPGLDGTGQLFRQIVTALPAHIVPTVVSYPSDLPLAYAELETIVGEALPATSEFAILAESYSGPLALRIAARRPAGLRAIVLTATFATAPRRWPAWMLWLVSPFRPQHLPAWCVRYSLLGSDAPHALVAEFYDAVSAVQPQVLQARLSDVLSADVREELRTCAYPILYLAATHDRLVSIRASQRMKEIQPAMEIATIKGPHLLLQREPEAAAKQICKFLQRVFANVTPY